MNRGAIVGLVTGIAACVALSLSACSDDEGQRSSADAAQTLQHDSKTCINAGWTTDVPNVQIVPIRAGYLTSLSTAQCI